MRRGETQVFITLGFLGFLFLMPFSGNGADLTISNVITASGDITVHGAMNAISFWGSGSGLMNLDPTKLSSGTANINISGNAATATTFSGVLGGDVTGSQGATTVTRIQNRGISSTIPMANQVLRYDGNNWNPSAVSLQTDVTGVLPVAGGGTGSSTKSFVDLSTAQTVGGAKTFSSPIGSTVATGTAPFQVNSTTMVVNLNADMVGGQRLSDLNSIYQKKYTKVAVVEPYGNGDYTNPATAISDSLNWCGTATAIAPCLLKIMPGYYDVGTSSVQMKSYIDIEGSGENTTTISGTIDSSTTGVVNGGSHVEIRLLTIENRGASGNSNTLALCNYHAEPKITNVTIKASGGTFNYGVYNEGTYAPILFNVTVTASGGSGGNYGIYNYFSWARMHNVTVSASGGGGLNYGIYNLSATGPFMSRSSVNASGGTYNYGLYNNNSALDVIDTGISATFGTNTYGIYNDLSSWFSMRNGLVYVSDGNTYNYGILNDGSSSVYLTSVISEASSGADSFALFNTNTGGVVRANQSVLQGQRSVRNDNASATAKAYVGSSQLNGQVLGNVKCAGVYNISYDFYPSSCP
jgi:hypothetical protein